MKLTRIQIRSKEFITLSVSLVFIVLLVFLTINQWTIFSTARREFNEEETQVNALKEKIEAVDKLKEDETIIMDRFQALRYMVAGDKGNGQLLDHIQSELTNYNIQAIELGISDEVEQEGYVEVPVKLSLRGEYEGIIKFIHTLRMGKRPFRIHDIHMDRDDNYPSKIHCQISAYGFTRGE